VPNPEFQIEALDASRHDRQSFECESLPLTAFLRERARREMESRTSICFVLVPINETSRIAGYYTLSSTSILYAKLPDNIVKRLPRYPDMPATLLGRLARDAAFRGQGIGDLLIRSALLRAWTHSEEIGSIAVVTDPKDQNAKSFYEKYGFAALTETRLFIPMKEVAGFLRA
jgi:ribosomal protein S18 acetylase RimI-like enzyme